MSLTLENQVSNLIIHYCDLSLVNWFCHNYLLRARLTLNSSVCKLLNPKLNLMHLLPGKTSNSSC